MTFKLYQHQQEAVDFILNTNNALLWHEVGLGKTLSSVFAARTTLSRIRNHKDLSIRSHSPKALVIPPTYLVPQWRSEVIEHAPDMVNQLIYVPYSQLHNAKALTSYYDIRMVILDEWHYLKNPKVVRMKNFQDTLKNIYRNGQGFRGGKIAALTGTPMPNNASEMYTAWALLSAPNIGESIRRMNDAKRYLEWNALFTKKKLKIVPKNKRTHHTKAYESLSGVEQPEKFHEVIKNFTHFRRAEDCLDLPQKLENFIDLGIADDQLLKDADIRRPDAYMAFVERISRAMAPHAIKWVEDFVAANPGERLVVFCPHVSPLKALKEKFGAKMNLIIGGSASVDKRNEYVAAYNRGEAPILGGTYAAMSTGYNLQKGFNSLYIGYPWSPKTIRQAQGRTNRSGQTRKTRHNFLMSGQNARKVLNDLRDKEAGIDSIEQQLLMNQDSQNMEMILKELI